MDKKTVLLVFMTFLLGISLVLVWQQLGGSKINTAQLKPITASPTPASSPLALASPVVSAAPAIASPIPVSPSPVSNPFSNWTTHTNNTFKYRFLYDPSWNLTIQSNTVSVQGDVSTKGWPSISVSKLTIVASDITELKTKVESMFSETTTQVSIGSGISAVLLERAASPQAYAGKDYYFLHQGNTLHIGLNDTGHTQADQLYQHFLDNFELY